MNCIEQMRNNIAALMERTNFSAEAKGDMLFAFDCITADSAVAEDLFGLVALYDESIDCDYNKIVNCIQELGEKFGICEYTSKLLIFLCLAERLRLRYTERGIDEKIFYDSMCDLQYKLEECRLIKGVNGTFVAPWFVGFFNLTRFHLNRLQFEVLHTEKDFLLNCKPLKKGTKFINVHIPRTNTKLSHSLVEDSYRQAVEFFSSEFENEPIYFGCHSWMLYPWNMEVLSPTSNMAAFYNDFTIVESGDDKDYSEIWRLFDCEYDGSADNLPCDTSLRRAYVERIKNGGAWGWGQGIFEYKK